MSKTRLSSHDHGNCELCDQLETEADGGSIRVNLRIPPALAASIRAIAKLDGNGLAPTTRRLLSAAVQAEAEVARLRAEVARLRADIDRLEADRVRLILREPLLPSQ